MKNSNWRNKKTEILIKGLLTLETTSEAANFLRDLMTPQEIEIFSSRLEAARLLKEGKLSYRQIAKDTGMSTTTITRINTWLNKGMNGYQTVLSKLHHHNDTDSAVL